MKAVNNAGIITFYQSVPNSFRSSTGLHLNVKGWSSQDMKDNGLFDVIIDDSYDSRIHDLGEIYWDTGATVFKKDKSNKSFDKSVSELKEQSISNFKSRIGGELAKTDWYIIREADNGADVPADVVDARVALRELSDTVESEINALTTKAKVITYDFPNI
ncbi:MAG: hypothetical protein HN624_03110 [Flavobacteriaceae bacterium]|nr:hypothetical protein [Flavobacteriaceae bacterium]